MDEGIFLSLNNPVYFSLHALKRKHELNPRVSHQKITVTFTVYFEIIYMNLIKLLH